MSQQDKDKREETISRLRENKNSKDSFESEEKDLLIETREPIVEVGAESKNILKH